MSHASLRLLLLATVVVLGPSQLAAVVTPTPEVLAWQLHDTGCFLTYNMASMIGSGGCRDELTSPPPLSAWRPVALDTDAWAATCKAMGGTRIVFTAKHSCGFLAWKTKTAYNYSVGFTPDGTDVVAAFVKSARSAGLGVGFYYSSAHNSRTRTSHDGIVQPGLLLPNQIRVTQQEYNADVLAHLRELWTQYGALEELWFDGGYDAALKPNITALLAELQPHAVVFGGVGLTPVRERSSMFTASPCVFTAFQCLKRCPVSKQHALGWAGTENGLGESATVFFLCSLLRFHGAGRLFSLRLSFADEPDAIAAPYPAWSTWSPPPPAPLPPPPPAHCTIQASSQRCYNDTARGSVLPVSEPATHDRTTLEICAAACFEDRRQGVFNTLAGIDGGNHCWCGTEADAGSAAAKAKARPLAECQASPCHADKGQKCGGVDRLLVYSFVCTPGTDTRAVVRNELAGRPLPTSYGAANGTVWLPAEEDFTLQAEDSWFCKHSRPLHLRWHLRVPLVLGRSGSCLPVRATLTPLLRQTTHTRACARQRSCGQCSRPRAVATPASSSASAHLPTGVCRQTKSLPQRRLGRTSAAATAQKTQSPLVLAPLGRRTRPSRSRRHSRPKLTASKSARIRAKGSLCGIFV